MKHIALFSAVVLFLLAPGSQAWTEKSLEAADPFVFRPSDLDLDQFTLQSDIPWHWVKGSFEWVRVDRKFLIPRARVVLDVPAQTTIKYLGRHFQSDQDQIEVPIALTQEKGNELEIQGKKPSKIRVLFKPKREINPAMILDTTCSSTPIRITSSSLKHSWGHVYCHPTHPNQEVGHGLRMDVDLIWETEGAERKAVVSGVVDESGDGVTHQLSFSQSTPTYELKKGSDSFTLTAPLPGRFHPFGVSLGLGPYSHRDVLRPFATIYAAYLFNEGLKVASFTAFPVHSKPEVDTGVYMIVEQFRGIDERVTLNLLLGAHALSFQSGGEGFLRFSAPQGVELNFRDCLIRGQNFTLGGFFYPKISNRYYVNSWIRYGNAKFFYEFNFINWQEPLDDVRAFGAKSAGISVGFPLFRAF